MKKNLRKYTFTGLCMALCVVFPMAFHAIPNAGQTMLPMHIPVLICGLACGWQYGLLCGAVGPLLSSMLTGMPPAAMLPAMMVELAAYGLCTALMMKFVRTKNIYADLYISLVCAMLIGRVAAGTVKALFFAQGGITIAAWASTYFVTGLPGIIIQLVFVPAIYLVLQRAKVIPYKYFQNQDEAV